MLWLRRLFVLARNAVICLALFQAFQKLVVAALVCSSKFPSFIYRFYNKFPMNFGQNRHFLSNRLLVFWFTLKSTIFWLIFADIFPLFAVLARFFGIFYTKIRHFLVNFGWIFIPVQFLFFRYFFYTKIRHFFGPFFCSISSNFGPIFCSFSSNFGWMLL